MSSTILSLARFQFGMTTVFHFFFVPMSIGLALVVAIMETLYVVKKKDIYKDMAKFWGKIFLLSFAVGVVTGIIQEFQFGMNWSTYSRFVGDIFGAPLAIEALLAFFLESTFIGLWTFGWEKFSKKVHLLFMWLVVIGSSLSALWILIANGFMQDPVGYTYNPETGRAELTNFLQLITSPQAWYEFTHVVIGAFLLGGFLVAGMSAWKLLKKQNTEFFKKSMKLGLILGLVSACLSFLTGDLQMKFLLNSQPTKFAAMEAIYEDTEDPAPWSFIASIDTKNKEVKSVDIPYMLSILSYNKPSGAVKGMNSAEAAQRVKFKDVIDNYKKKHDGKDISFELPVKTIYWSFRLMAFSAGVFGLVSIIGLWFLRKKKDVIEKQRWFLYIAGICTFLPFVSTTSGWLITELGRYPWVVYGLLTIEDAVSPNVSAGQLWFSNIVYFSLFAILGAVMVFLAKRTLNQGPYLDKQNANDTSSVDPFEKGAFDHE